jgi:hypothetical protein
MAQEQGYIVERSTDGGATWGQLADLAAGTTSDQHTGLTAGSTRHYRVKAKGDGTTTTDSAYTAVVSATTQAPPSSQLQDDFADPAHTATLWDVTNNNAARMDMVQEEGMFKLRPRGGGKVTLGTDAVLISKQSFTGGVFAFNVAMKTSNTTVNRAFGIGMPGIGNMYFYRQGATDTFDFRANGDNGTAKIPSPGVSSSPTVFVWLKIVCLNTETTAFYWNGTGWVAFGAKFTFAVSPFKIVFNSDGTSGTATADHELRVSEVFYHPTDFTGLRP